MLGTDNGHPLKIRIEFHILQGCRLNLSKVVSPIRCPVEIPLNLVPFGFRCIGHHSCDLCAEYTKEGRSGQVCEWHLNINLTRIKVMNREELLQRLSWLQLNIIEHFKSFWHLLSTTTFSASFSYTTLLDPLCRVNRGGTVDVDIFSTNLSWCLVIHVSKPYVVLLWYGGFLKWWYPKIDGF